MINSDSFSSTTHTLTPDERATIERAAVSAGETVAGWTEDRAAILLVGRKAPWNPFAPNPHTDFMGDAFRLASMLDIDVTDVRLQKKFGDDHPSKAVATARLITRTAAARPDPTSFRADPAAEEAAHQTDVQPVRVVPARDVLVDATLVEKLRSALRFYDNARWAPSALPDLESVARAIANSSSGEIAASDARETAPTRSSLIRVAQWLRALPTTDVKFPYFTNGVFAGDCGDAAQVIEEAAALLTFEPSIAGCLTEVEYCAALQPLANEFVASANTTRRIVVAVQQAMAKKNNFVLAKDAA